MPFSHFNIEEILTFFAVLVRMSVLFSIIPFFGDRLIPSSLKILLSLSISLMIFPALAANGFVNVADAKVWGSTSFGIVGTIALEVIFGLTLGYVTRLTFEAISFGANLVGTYMGFASASTYDPHQEAQTQVIANIQTTVAMLLFLALDGHHMMLKAILDSYKIIGIGKVAFGILFEKRLISMTSEVFLFGVQMSSPVAIGLFLLNMIFGVISKALPQMNILVLSFAANALVGFMILFISFLEFHDSVGGMFGKMNEWMRSVMILMAKGG